MGRGAAAAAGVILRAAAVRADLIFSTIPATTPGGMEAEALELAEEKTGGRGFAGEMGRAILDFEGEVVGRIGERIRFFEFVLYDFGERT